MADINIENLTVNTRSLNGSRLTHQQLDDNFNNLLAAVQQVAGQGGGAAPASSPLIPAPSITAQDVGKIVMMNYDDGQVQLYSYVPMKLGLPGIYDITVINPNPVDIEFHAYNLSISSSWLPSPYPATTDEAATLLRDYLNNNYADILTAGGIDSNVTVTFLAAPSYQADAWVSNADYSLTTVQQAQPNTPARPRGFFLGVITEVDGAGYIRVDNSPIITAIAGEEVLINSSGSSELLSVAVLEGGSVGLFNQATMDDESMLGFPFNGGSVGDDIVIWVIPINVH